MIVIIYKICAPKTVRRLPDFRAYAYAHGSSNASTSIIRFHINCKIPVMINNEYGGVLGVY